MEGKPHIQSSRGGNFPHQADSLTFESYFVPEQMNLVIDSGNSAAKVGIFDHLHLVQKFSFESGTALYTFIGEGQYENALISSVKSDEHSIASALGKVKRKFVLTRQLALPVRNLYATPDTLGMDRLAAACGAHALFPSSDCLAIDAGSCITYEFIDRSGSYHGGAISPGLRMRFEAVHTFTSKLPLVSPKTGVDLIGDTTETAIQSGVVNGILAEMEGVIRRYREKYPDLKVILCGGDTGFFENQLKASIFASPDLVLVGLNSILIYNVNRS